MRTNLQNSIPYKKSEVKQTPNSDDTFPKLVNSPQSSYPKKRKEGLVETVAAYSMMAAFASLALYLPCLITQACLVLKGKENKILEKANNILLPFTAIATAPAFAYSVYHKCREYIIDSKMRKNKKYRKELS